MRARSTRVSRRVNAPPASVYRALLDARTVARWMVPAGMTSHVHAFEAREGGRFRISLTYDAPTGTGKTTAHTDTYHGRFVTLVPNERVVEVVEFETADPAMRGEMTIAITLADADGGTDVRAVHDRLPRGLSPEDNEAGWRSSLERLAALVDADHVARARFFHDAPRSARLHAAVRRAVHAAGPARERVTRSQVSFRRRRAFAWTWMPRRYLGARAAPLVLSIALRRRDRSPRWKEIVEPRPGWFMHHLELRGIKDVDRDVRTWLAEAWSAAG